MPSPVESAIRNANGAKRSYLSAISSKHSSRRRGYGQDDGRQAVRRHESAPAGRLGHRGHPCDHGAHAHHVEQPSHTGSRIATRGAVARSSSSARPECPDARSLLEPADRRVVGALADGQVSQERRAVLALLDDLRRAHLRRGPDAERLLPPVQPLGHQPPAARVTLERLPALLPRLEKPPRSWVQSSAYRKSNVFARSEARRPLAIGRRCRRDRKCALGDLVCRARFPRHFASKGVHQDGPRPEGPFVK